MIIIIYDQYRKNYSVIQSILEHETLLAQCSFFKTANKIKELEEKRESQYNIK